MTNLPASQRAEESVLGAVLRDPSLASEVIGSMLEPEHFHFGVYRVVYERIVESHYGDDPIDPLTVAEAVSKRVAGMWKIEEREAVDRIVQLAATPVGDAEPIVEHAAVIRRHAEYRSLLRLSERLRQAVEVEEDTPEEIAGAVSADAMRIATATLMRHQVLSYGDVGRRWVTRTRRAIAAREAGIELGAYFGIPAIDDYIKGLKPTELLFCGGDPGAGKSALWWTATYNFANRQSRNPEGNRVSALILSLEMGEEPSADRLATAAGTVEGGKLREATLTRSELMDTARRWAARKDIPLYFAHSSRLRASQLRAIVIDAIKRHNVGLVVVDHFRMVRPDDKRLRSNEADDEVVEQLNMLASDLGVAVVVLSHTTKSRESTDRRPRLEDLRGSGMIAAFADFVCFIHRPWRHASEQQRDRGLVTRKEAELIWAKSRHTGEGTGHFQMDLADMSITT